MAEIKFYYNPDSYSEKRLSMRVIKGLISRGLPFVAQPKKALGLIFDHEVFTGSLATGLDKVLEEVKGKYEARENRV